MSNYEILVKVRAGRDLAHKKMLEKPAVYVKISVDDLSQRTEIINELEHPSWNSTFSFEVDQIPQRILFEVKDDRTLLPNIKLGNYNIDLKNVFTNLNEPMTLIDGEVPLQDTTQGNLNVCVVVQPRGWNKQHKKSSAKTSKDVEHKAVDSATSHHDKSDKTNKSAKLSDEPVQSSNYSKSLEQGSKDRCDFCDTSVSSRATGENLTVTILYAEGIKKGDFFSKSDPYVIIRCNGYEQKTSTTSTKNNNHQPSWNETFSIPLKSNEWGNIEFKVMDDDILKDDNIGIATLNQNELMNLSNNMEQPLTLPIRLKDKHVGELHLKIRYDGRSFGNNLNPNMSNMNNLNNMNNMNSSGSNTNWDANYVNNRNLPMSGNANEQWEVTVLDAVATKKSDWFTNADPYVVIRFGGEEIKTKVSDHKRYERPTWNESFKLSPKHNNWDNMEILLMDDDLLKDDQMGRGWISRNDLMKLTNNELDFNVPLSYKKQENAGSVHLKMRRLNGNNLQGYNNNVNMGMSGTLSSSNNENTTMNNDMNRLSLNEHRLSGSSNLDRNRGYSGSSSSGSEQLRVTILDAQGLKDSDWIGKAEPYVLIKFGSAQEKTKIAQRSKHDSNLVWNETLNFPFRSNELYDMEILIMDDDILKDDKMGRGWIRKNELMNLNNMEQEFNIPLQFKGKQAGSLRLKIQNWMNNNNNLSGNYNNLSNANYIPVEKESFYSAPEDINRPSIIVDDKKDEERYNTSTHTFHQLPTIYVQEKPCIVEKEIIYEKPVEVQSTIVHREKPIIVEQPIIKEKYEHYREKPEIISHNEKIVHESIDQSMNLNNEKTYIENLQHERLNQYQDTQPIIQTQQEYVQLAPTTIQQPVQIQEKKITYEQPIEIERKYVEHVKPKIEENIILEKEHVHQKLKPEIIQLDAQKQFEGDHYLSQSSNQNISSYDRNRSLSSGNMSYNQGGEWLLTILEAHSNNKSDKLSKSDCYVVIKHNNQTLYKTKTAKNTEHPSWNEEVKIPMTSGDIELLLMDDDLLKDDKMGRAIISPNQLNNIMFGQEQTLALPLSISGKNIGIIHIRMKKLSHDNENVNSRASAFGVSQAHQQHGALSHDSYGSRSFSGSYGSQASTFNSQSGQYNAQMPHDYYNDYNKMSANDFNIQVIGADLKVKGDVLTKSDPYVLIKYGGEQHQTKTSHGQSPRWDEILQFHRQGNQSSDLEIIVMDDDTFRDDPIGRATIPFSQISNFRSDQELNIPIQGKNKEAGVVHLRLTADGNMRQH